MSLRWNRTFNTKNGGGWSFGLSGVPMGVVHAEFGELPVGPSEQPSPDLYTSDGARHPTFISQAGSQIWMATEFWHYQRTQHIARLPNGIACDRPGHSVIVRRLMPDMPAITVA